MILSCSVHARCIQDRPIYTVCAVSCFVVILVAVDWTQILEDYLSGHETILPQYQ